MIKLLGSLLGDNTIKTLSQLFVGDKSKKTELTIIAGLIGVLLHVFIPAFDAEILKVWLTICGLGAGFFGSRKLTKAAKKL